MNAVEIEEAVSQLADAPFDPEEFPFAFLEAFGNKPTTIKRLRSGNTTNKSDLPGGILQRNNIHLKVCPVGEVGATLTALRLSPVTTQHKAKFILATDGQSLEAENLADGETIACDYPQFADHFGFFLPLAGITTVKQIRENAFDIKATARLNRLYVELLKDNPDWDMAERRQAFNHFMARLIFCFFAEDTNIFRSEGFFTTTVAQMSAGDASNTHEVLGELFRAMCTPIDQRKDAQLRNWADGFPYVNGGLFSGEVDVPRFSKIARSYLLHVGSLDWTKINPDIFGSMIQAVADDEERGSLGMHYTSVPNILKVLNPLFLDDLREQLEAAGDNARKLLNLRQRMARIRVFDPACGSGNFLVIAYKEMREIEAEINRRRGDIGRGSEIPLSNFRGIEIRHFSAEISRLALVIAKYQCDVLHLGQLEARMLFLPLERDNWITYGNALRLDWLSVCPPTGMGVKVQQEDLDLFSKLNKEAEIDFENEGGETYICGNPPYLGNKRQKADQKSDLEFVFSGKTSSWKSLDYVAAWLFKSAEFISHTGARSALVCTNSICQGQLVSIIWPLIYRFECEIFFAYSSFRWKNLASNAAVVTVAIIGLSLKNTHQKELYKTDEAGNISRNLVSSIGPYLIPDSNVIVKPRSKSLSGMNTMLFGNMPRDEGHLLLSIEERRKVISESPFSKYFIKSFLGSDDIIHGKWKACIWVREDDFKKASQINFLNDRFERVRRFRLGSPAGSTQSFAAKPYRFVQIQGIASRYSFIVSRHSSEHRPYLPIGIYNSEIIVADSAFALYDAPLWNMALIASRLHLVWIVTVCGKIKTDPRYSNTLGWNTFPVPTLTEQNKTDLTRCAEGILLAREHYFPATIADMYDPERMDPEFPLVREAHDRNDEVLERIYIGRRFKNDTERLEKLFEMYTKMTSQQQTAKKPGQQKKQAGKR